MKILLRAVALFAIVAWCIAARPPPKLMATNVFADTHNDARNFSGVAGAPFMTGSPVSVYIIWYNCGGTNWTAHEKQLTIDLINNIHTTAWYSAEQEYPGAAGLLLPSFTVAASLTDDAGEGTSGSWDRSAIATHVTNGDFSFAPQGIYMALASDTNCTLGVGFGEHFAQATVPGTVQGLATTRMTPAVKTTIRATGPNGDDPFDGETEVLTHEMMESAAAGWTGSGGEPCDVCSGGASIIFDAGSGYASMTLTLPDGGPNEFFAAADIWIPSQGGYCYQGEFPTAFYTIPCRVNADCPAFSAHCDLYHCQAPSCSDKIQNGAESDVDCGWWCNFQGGLLCGPSQHCGYDGDCTSGHSCSGGVCV